MKIEDLKNARLSESTQGYLAIHIKLDELYQDILNVVELNYPGAIVDEVAEDVDNAIFKAKEEVLKLALDSIVLNLVQHDNHTKI